MWFSSILLLGAGLGIAAADSSESQATQTTEWVEWSTTVSTAYSTIHDTATSYVTLTGPTTTETETKTVTQLSTVSITGPTTTETGYKTITEVNTITQTSAVTIAPITVTVTVPSTIVQTIPQTVQNTVVSTATVESASTVRQTATIEETATVNNVITATITSVSRVTQTVSVPGSTQTQLLSGLVTCPTRIINPTYTPSAALPSNYLWGCPPGQLCRPTRIDCNFEQNPPAEGYVCAPEECLPVADLPALSDFLAASPPSNDSCAWLTPADDYFNFDPLFFGYNFGIFDVYGQATCTTTPLVSTVTVSVSNSCAAGSTLTIVGTTSSTVTSPAGTSPAGTSSTGTSPAGTSRAGSSSTTSTWSDWSSSAPAVTKRAELKDRKLAKRQGVVVGKSCYAQCDYAGYVYQSIGRDPALCSDDSPWSSAFSVLQDCTDEFTATGATSVASLLNQAILYCENQPSKRGIRGRRA